MRSKKSELNFGSGGLDEQDEKQTAIVRLFNDIVNRF